MNTTTLSQPIRRTLAVALIGEFVFGFGTNTAAADESGVPKANIRFGDLNLATPQGAKLLYERIVSAAYDVCQSFDRDRNDNADPLALHACVRKIIADAVVKVGKSTLYAVNDNGNAKPLPAPIVIAESRK